MKCLSLQQPWAELIVSGRKTIETRKWKTNFRGEFLIHCASSMRYKDYVMELGFDPDKLDMGAIIGSAILKNVICYDTKEKWDNDYNKHFAKDFPKCPMYGFVLENIKRFDKSIPMKGKLNFFNVDI